MDPASPDARLSNYELGPLLGAGGMGSVYLARDLALDRPVAIKFIAAERAGDLTAHRRLLREARAAAALDHPNICTIYEVIDAPDGRACIVMQYVEGETLSAVLRKGPLEIAFVIGLALDLAAALAAAHKRGIVHRDVKPQNVIITPERRAKLLDFGVAQYAAPTASSDQTATALTTAGLMVGSPAYMSPEQVQGRPVDGRSDLFALGAVLFECFTGQRAFSGRSPLELAAQIASHSPPTVSSLRPDLGPAHDELLRRLLARNPADRFQSADDLADALRALQAGTDRSLMRDTAATPVGPTRRPRAILAALAVLLLAGTALWRWEFAGANAPPAAAAEWYRLGVQAIRDGSPHSARLALTEAVKAAPEYAPAYVRLAEAETELGEADSAQQDLLRVSRLVPSESKLPFEDRKRVEAVRALMLRDVDGAVHAYAEIARRKPDDPGVWLDLGRAQDESALRDDARASYERAVAIDATYAAAHLRRGSILGLEGKRAEALAAFAEAERLYRASANTEGEIETLIRRATFLNGAGDLALARADLERANDLAGNIQSRAQQIRAQLTLSSVIAAEGKWDEAERMAGTAVDAALRAELETVAATGLVELAGTLFFKGKTAEADAKLQRAIELADKRRAETIKARAMLQRASIMVALGRYAEALQAAEAPLEYVRSGRYRRLELAALAIMARARANLAQFAEARALAERALAVATEIKDEAQQAEALENLAAQANATGALAAAAEYRARGTEIHRRQNDLARLAFDLVNRADLLIRLGRHGEAAALLDEIDGGASRKVDAFLSRARRAKALRAMSAAIQRRFPETRRLAQDVPAAPDGKPDATAQLVAALSRYAGDPGAGGATSLAGTLESATDRELRYWGLLATLSRGDSARALSAATETIGAKQATLSYEFEWRVAAIGAAAARQLRDGRSEAFADRARRALARLRTEWKSDVASYDARPDLVELRRKAGLN